MTLPSLNAARAVGPVRHLRRRAVRPARPRPQPDLGPAAPDQPRALRARVPRRLPRYQLSATVGARSAATLADRAARCSSRSASRMQWLLRALRRHAVQLAAGHLRPHRHRSRALIQWIWTADFRQLESRYGTAKFTRRRALRAGARAAHAGRRRRRWRGLIWAVLRYTDLGKALRALRRGRADRRRVRRQPGRAGAAARRLVRRARRRRRRLPRAELHAGAVADLRLGRRRVRRGDAGRARQRARPAGRRHGDRRQRGGDDGGDLALVGAARLVHAADRGALLRPDRDS